MKYRTKKSVTVQSCIDKSRGKEVFVLATVNHIQVLPDSLLRPGRFDKIILVDTPNGKEAAEIIQYYIRSKECIAEIDVDSIAGDCCYSDFKYLYNRGNHAEGSSGAFCS